MTFTPALTHLYGQDAQKLRSYNTNIGQTNPYSKLYISDESNIIVKVFVNKEMFESEFQVYNDLKTRHLRLEMKGSKRSGDNDPFCASIELPKVTPISNVGTALQHKNDMKEILRKFHHLGYTHGDAQWRNFVLATDGQLRLIDFDMASNDPLNFQSRKDYDFTILSSSLEGP